MRRECRVARRIAIAISGPQYAKATAGARGLAMFRLLKYLLILAVLVAIGLLGYSYLLEPDSAPVTETIQIDAG
jgi:hypothetical protein